MGLFFNKRGEQKQWVIILTIVFPFIFSVWGIIISVRSYRLSVQASENKEQIDSLAAIITEIKEQNQLLQKLIVGHDSLLQVTVGEVKYARRPRLTAEMTGGDISNELSNISLNITNTGGDIFDLSYFPTKGVRIDSLTSPKGGSFPSGSNFEIRVLNLTKQKHVIRFRFRDGLHNKYEQDLVWSKIEGGDYLFHFVPLRELAK